MREVHLTPSGSSGSTTTKCQICRSHGARYTCPACNLRYCSLACFKSEKHADCSETFYRASITAEIASSKDVDNEEKRNVLDMLRRLEESDEAFAALDDELEDRQGGGLGDALEGLDIDSLSPEELLARLSPEQQAEFRKILQDPRLAAELLNLEGSDEGLAAVSPRLWWQEDILSADEDDGDAAEGMADRKGKGVARRPEPIKRERLLPVPSQQELGLGYNLVAILAAYVLLYRIHDSDDAMDDKQRFLSELLPFLAEKSTLVMSNAREGMEYVVSRLRTELIADRHKLILLLIDDVLCLLTSLKVSIVNSGNDEPSDNAFLALSDLNATFSTSSGKKKSEKQKMVAPKVLFYASNLSRIPREEVRRALMKYRDELLREESADKTLMVDVKDPLSISAKPERKSASAKGIAKIEEIP